MKSSNKGQNGFIYAVAGQKYIDEAIKSCLSIRKVNPDANVTIFSDQPIENHPFNQVVLFEQDMSQYVDAKCAKIKAMAQSPYERTIFIDSDTYFTDDCLELFDLLEYFEMILTDAPMDYYVSSIHGKQLNGYFSYNSGVVGYVKNRKILDFFNQWEKYLRDSFDEFPWDQPSFMKAFIDQKINHYILKNIYNFRTPFINSVGPVKVKIIHGRHDDMEKIARTINASTANRVWMPDDLKVIVSKSDQKENKYLKKLKFKIKKLKAAFSN